MPGDVYSVDQIIDKTLIAATDVAVYEQPIDSARKIATVKKGQPVGIVSTYFLPKPAEGRTTVYWGFWPVDNYSKPYYAPHIAGLYDTSALKQQGVLTVEEEIEREEEKNKEWYEKILDKIIPVGIVAILGAAVIRGLLSRK